MASTRSSGTRDESGNARPQGTRVLRKRVLVCVGVFVAVLACVVVVASMRCTPTDERRTDPTEDPVSSQSSGGASASLEDATRAPDTPAAVPDGMDAVGETGAGEAGPLGTVDGSGGADAAAQLERLAEGAGTSVQQEASDEEVDTVARSLLGRYRDEGTCLLMSAGYLDLMGRVWGCVVEGPGWVDVCVVEKGADAGSTTRLVRLAMGTAVPDAS